MRRGVIHPSLQNLSVFERATPNLLTSQPPNLLLLPRGQPDKFKFDFVRMAPGNGELDRLPGGWVAAWRGCCLLLLDSSCSVCVSVVIGMVHHRRNLGVFLFCSRGAPPLRHPQRPCGRGRFQASARTRTPPGVAWPWGSVGFDQGQVRTLAPQRSTAQQA